MSLHKPSDHHFIVIGGNVLTSSGSLKLTKGQIGFFDTKSLTKDGLTPVTSVAGMPKSNEFQIKLGTAPLPVTRSLDNKAFSTFPFKLSEVLDVRVSAPKSSTQTVDEVVAGYNGMDANTSIVFKKGDRKSIYLRLSGEYIGMLGYPENFVTIEYTMQEEPCSPFEECTECDECTVVECAPIVARAVEYLKRYELRGGVKVEDVVEITPVKSCTEAPSFVETTKTFYSMSVCDTGDQNALALVQAQYPGLPVVRTDRKGSTSTYQILSSEGLPAAYTQTIASILKGCEDCPAEWDEIQGGILYSITIADENANLSASIQALPNTVTGTATKQSQNGAIGMYTVVVTSPLSSSAINTFLSSEPSATFELVGTTASICENDGTTTSTWVAGEVCTVSSQSYTIVVPDNKCGESRLAELQTAYPDMDIEVLLVNSANSSQEITLTGTSGTATVTIGAETYLATFASSLSTTATNFVSTHAATILSATGVTVTNDGATLIFTHPTTDFPTISIENTTTDLDGTLGEVEVVQVEDRNACQTRYIGTVVTNLACEECDPIFKDHYVSEEPKQFDIYKWKLVEPTPSFEGCSCGIRFKGKELSSYPNEDRRYSLGFIESAVNVEVSGGYITEVREGLGKIVDEPFAITYLSKYEPRTHVGGNLWEFEKRSRMYFSGRQEHEDEIARMFLGEESHLDASTQYVDYAITIRRNQYAQSLSDTHHATNTYHIIVEFGKHTAVQNMVNLIASGAGLPAVSV